MVRAADRSPHVGSWQAGGRGGGTRETGKVTRFRLCLEGRHFGRWRGILDGWVRGPAVGRKRV